MDWSRSFTEYIYRRPLEILNRMIVLYLYIKIEANVWTRRCSLRYALRRKTLWNEHKFIKYEIIQWCMIIIDINPQNVPSAHSRYSKETYMVCQLWRHITPKRRHILQKKKIRHLGFQDLSKSVRKKSKK